MLLIGCARRERVGSSEEEAVYLLVGDPCREGDYATAIGRADSLLAAPRVMSDTLMAYIMIDRDVALSESGDLDRAYAYADTLIDFGRKHGIGLAVMQGLQNQGIICRRKGDWDKAISLYKEGMDIAVGEDDLEMQQVFAEMIAVACGQHGLYEEALSFGGKSLAMAKEMNDSLQELNAASTIGAILAGQGKYAEAVECLRPYRNRVHSVRNILKIKYLTPLLKSYLNLDSLKKTRETLQEIHAALEGVSQKTQAYLVMVNAEAMLAEKEGRFADQWRWLLTADSIGGMGSLPGSLYDERARCLANLHRYREAYEMQARAYVASDSMRSAQNDTRLTEMTVKYDSLQKDKAISELKAQRLVWSVAALSIILVLIVVVMTVVYINIRNSRRLERQRQEEYIRGLEHERRRIARELHDDIAGSLVGLQLKLRVAPPEESEEELIRLNRRVRTMSHEMMPPEFGSLGFLEILRDYARRFRHDSGVPAVELSHTGSFDWDSLSAEECHELYRIVQESVSNAIRHGDKNCCVRIALSGDDCWQLTVESKNGSDSGAEGFNDGIGTRTLRDRAAIVGANLEIVEKDGYYIIILKKRK